MAAIARATPDLPGIRALTGAIGAEILGVDLRTRPADEALGAIRRALVSHAVVCFRRQELTPEQHVEVGRWFGEIHVPAVMTRHGGPPELQVLNQTSPRGEGADSWHADETYLPTPPMGTILRAVELPGLGGDTCFADMCAAYESLSPAWQRFLCGLRAVHDISLAARRAIARGHMRADLGALQQRFPPVVHPVVRTHPESGRKLIFVNRNATTHLQGLSETESRTVLANLFALPRAPELQCRIHWSPGDVVFFDNRRVQHYAVPDYEERRVMHRVTIRGDRPR